MKKMSSEKKRSGPVIPLKSETDIQRIREMIQANPRNLLLFDLAVETGMRANHLLKLKVKDLQDLKPGAPIDSKGLAIMGSNSHKTFQRYLNEIDPIPDDYIFKSRKGSGALSTTSASRMVRSWFENIGLHGMSGLLSLRKTWAMRQRPVLAKRKQSSPETTDKQTYQPNRIKAPTVQELVYKELEHAIISAKIPPGEKLVSEDLARKMGVSRIPVREAIGRLEALNFVTVLPKKGIVVNSLSEKNLLEILDIRLMLELPATRKAAQLRTSETLDTLERLNNQYIDAHRRKDPDQLLRVNQQFHFTIYRDSQMTILLNIIEALWNQVSPYYHIMYRQSEISDPQTGASYHRNIIHALEKKDSEEAADWVKTDLMESTEFLLKVFQQIKADKTTTIPDYLA